MSRLIDADALEEYISNCTESWYSKITYRDMVEFLRDAPTIEPVKGKWIETELGDFYECSNCSYTTDFRLTNFCPNCGADMRED